MKKTTIRQYMTPQPITLGANQPLATAHKLMREHRVRHLPVLRDGELVGVVSDRDLGFIESLKDVDPNTVAVEEAMSVDPFTLAPDAPLELAAVEMARTKLGCAIVIDNGEVVGVFTTNDALRALQDLLTATRKRPVSRRRVACS